jgi:threonine dehydrogenase-like Zn-dependent dehydrogenase
MKAGAVFPKQRKVGLAALDEPKISSPNGVKLRMLEVGVCGTDREICSFGYGTPPDGFDFLVLGHESLGQVVETGRDVTSVRAGDLVVPMVRRPCSHPECAACRAGRQDFCYTGDFQERGIKRRHGFMTDFVVDEEAYLHPVPPGLREVAILVEPLTIAEKALIQIGVIQRRLPWACPPNQVKTVDSCRSAVVLGAGPVGLRTYVYSRELPLTPRAGLAESFGAHYISSGTHSIEEFAALVGNIDVVYEASGASQTAFELLNALGADSVFVFTGVPRHGQPVAIHAELLMRNLVLKNQVILGTVNAGADAFQAAIHDLGVFFGRWPDAVRALITGRYPIEEFREPILAGSGIKNIIVLDGENGCTE